MGSPEPRPTLVLAGAVRHSADQARLDELRALADSTLDELGLPRSAHHGAAVHFAPNVSLPELLELFGRASVGVHTMWNEHFGIGVVEMLAAGLAVVAHRSGGPALDIIDDGRTGLLAETDAEYAHAITTLLLNPGAEARRASIAAAGRQSVADRFSEESFGRGVCAALRPVLQSAGCAQSP